MIYNRISVPETKDPWNINRVNDAYNYKEDFSLLSLLGILGGICRPPKKKNLRNKENGCFSVIISDVLYLSSLLELASFNGLTIRGDGTAKSKKNLNINEGDIITFGNSKSFDVDFISDPEYVRKNKLIPIYDIVDDYDTIWEAIKDMKKEKKSLSEKAGCPEEPLYRHLKGVSSKKSETINSKKKISVSTNWMVIDGQLYPKYYNDNVIIIR
jgi:hypothetical protein